MRHAFTLIELLVVVSIIAILASMLLPAVGAVRRQAGGMRFASNLRQVAMGTLAYVQDSEGVFPPFSDSRGWQWSAFVAPFVDETSPITGTAAQIRRSLFHDPGDDTRRYQNASQPDTYTCNVAINGPKNGADSGPCNLTQRPLATISATTEMAMLGPGVRASGYDNAGEAHGDQWGGAARMIMSDWKALGLARLAGIHARHGNVMHFAFVDAHVEARTLAWVVGESAKGDDNTPFIDRSRRY